MTMTKIKSCCSAVMNVSIHVGGRVSFKEFNSRDRGLHHEHRLWGFWGICVWMYSPCYDDSNGLVFLGQLGVLMTMFQRGKPSIATNISTERGWFYSTILIPEPRWFEWYNNIHNSEYKYLEINPDLKCRLAGLQYTAVHNPSKPN